MTIYHYVIRLDQKLQHKETTTIERKCYKQMMIESRGKSKWKGWQRDFQTPLL